MPRPRPAGLVRQVSRHGRVVWYWRSGHGKRTRIRGEFGSPEFNAQVQAASTGAPVIAPPVIAARTLHWLIEGYYESAPWRAYGEGSQVMRRRILNKMVAESGDKGVTSITQKVIVANRDRRAATPFQARIFMDTVRSLFGWAKQAQHIKVDPTEGVENLSRPKTKGFLAWTAEHQATYEARWPLGTRERVWLAVLRYTGLRRSDAVRVGRQHVARNPKTGRDEITISTKKSGGLVEVTIPICDELQAALDAGPVGDLCWITGTNGRPLLSNSFGNAFDKACDTAGVPGSAHGLRKLAATHVAENGGSEATLNALFGWRDPRMAQHYTQTASHKRLAREHGHLLGGNAQATPIPSPNAEVRELPVKTRVKSTAARR